MALFTAEIKRAEKILKLLAGKIPDTLFGIEKQMFIGDQIVGRLPMEQQSFLRQFFNSVLRHMRQQDASDIDLGGWGANGWIWLRIQGNKRPLPQIGQFSQNQTNILIQSLLMEGQRKLLYRNRVLDFSYTFTDEEGQMLRHRASCYFEMDELSLNMRAINNELRRYEAYGFHPAVTRVLSLAHSKEGLNLVTGITGSGKSTTLDAIVDLNNRTVPGHIIIIASPVEFVHQSDKCLVRHREVGRDTTGFKNGTIEALRQDPDIIIIGEMRDPETIMAALEVADSGHKVFSTLHTSSAVESIDRIIGEVPPVEQERVRNRLADILRCVISQKLVPSTDGKRVLATEVMLMTPSIRAAIKNNNVGEIYQMISEGGKSGMHTIEQDLLRLVHEKKIGVQTALNFANNKRRMRQLLNMQ